MQAIECYLANVQPIDGQSLFISPSNLTHPFQAAPTGARRRMSCSRSCASPKSSKRP
jgi:hypothetical protein